MNKGKLKIILAAAALSMLASSGMMAKGVYADETMKVNNDDKAAVSENTAGDKGLKISLSENEMTNSVSPTFTITNTSDSSLDLTKVNLRYYYTGDMSEDNNVEETFNCYYAGTIDGNYNSLTSYVKGSIVKMEQNDADSYINITFDGGSLEAGQSMTLQAAVNKSNWSEYDKTNDYSYNNAEKVCGLIDGNVVWGCDVTALVPVGPNQGSGSNTEIDENSVGVNIEPVGELKNGETVLLPVRVEGLSKDKAIYTWKLDFKYDTDVFEKPVVRAGYELDSSHGGESTPSVNTSTGIITLYYVNLHKECMENDDVIAVIALTVKDADAAQGKTGLVKGVNTGSCTKGDNTPLKVIYTNNTSTEAQLSGTPYISTSNPVELNEPPVKDKPIFFNCRKNDFIGIEGLTKNKDYSIEWKNSEIKLSKEYLLKLYEEGKDTTLKFNFTNGKSAYLQICKPNVEKLGASIEVPAEQSGNNVVVTPVIKADDLEDIEGKSIENLNVYFKYDTSLFKNVQIEKGDLFADVDNLSNSNYLKFTVNVDKETGIICLNYARQHSLDDDKYITNQILKGGELAKIILTPADGVDAQETELKSEGAYVVDKTQSGKYVYYSCECPSCSIELGDK